MAQTQLGPSASPSGHTAEGERHSLPVGISEMVSDDPQRLLNELHARQDAFEQQGLLVRQL
jgi:hypothetical protein